MTFPFPCCLRLRKSISLLVYYLLERTACAATLPNDNVCAIDFKLLARSLQICRRCCSSWIAERFTRFFGRWPHYLSAIYRFSRPSLDLSLDLVYYMRIIVGWLQTYEHTSQLATNMHPVINRLQYILECMWDGDGCDGNATEGRLLAQMHWTVVLFLNYVTVCWVWAFVHAGFCHKASVLGILSAWASLLHKFSTCIKWYQQNSENTCK